MSNWEWQVLRNLQSIFIATFRYENSYNQEVCSICRLEFFDEEDPEMNMYIFRTPCKHYFHQECLYQELLNKWLTGCSLKCPNCRAQIQ